MTPASNPPTTHLISQTEARWGLSGTLGLSNSCYPGSGVRTCNILALPRKPWRGLETWRPHWGACHGWCDAGQSTPLQPANDSGAGHANRIWLSHPARAAAPSACCMDAPWAANSLPHGHPAASMALTVSDSEAALGSLPEKPRDAHPDRLSCPSLASLLVCPLILTKTESVIFISFDCSPVPGHAFNPPASYFCPRDGLHRNASCLMLDWPAQLGLPRA